MYSLRIYFSEDTVLLYKTRCFFSGWTLVNVEQQSADANSKMALITKSPPEPVSQDQYLRVNVSELLQGQYLRISISEPAHQSLSNDVVLFIALMLGAGAISVVANVVVILTMVLTRKLRCKSSSAFVVSLSFADLGLTGVTVPLAVCSAVNGQWIFSQVSELFCMFEIRTKCWPVSCQYTMSMCLGLHLTPLYACTFCYTDWCTSENTHVPLCLNNLSSPCADTLRTYLPIWY